MQTINNTELSCQKQEAGLKVNLHIVEACNMHCEFCFAKFKCAKALTLEDWKCIVDNIVSQNK